MKFVRRYKNLNTNINALYTAIVNELQANKELNIVNELKGDINEKPFRSVTAVRKSIPRTFVGALREVTVTLTGEPNDFVAEVHTGSWFSNLAMPGTAGLLIAGPLGGAVGAGASAIVAADYQRKLSNRIRDLVKENSKNQLLIENVENFP